MYKMYLCFSDNVRVAEVEIKCRKSQQIHNKYLRLFLSYCEFIYSSHKKKFKHKRKKVGNS